VSRQKVIYEISRSDTGEVLSPIELVRRRSTDGGDGPVCPSESFGGRDGLMDGAC